MTEVRSSSSLSLCCAEEGTHEVTFVSRLSPEVTSSDAEKSLKDKLQLASLTCTRLKINIIRMPRFMSLLLKMISSLLIALELIVPYYGRLITDLIYCVEISVTSRPLLPGAESLCPPTPPPLDPIADFVNTD
jgi:hypothetical protein